MFSLCETHLRREVVSDIAHTVILRSIFDKVRWLRAAYDAGLHEAPMWCKTLCANGKAAQPMSYDNALRGGASATCKPAYAMLGFNGRLPSESKLLLHGFRASCTVPGFVLQSGLTLKTLCLESVDCRDDICLREPHRCSVNRHSPACMYDGADDDDDDDEDDGDGDGHGNGDGDGNDYDKIMSVIMVITCL